MRWTRVVMAALCTLATAVAVAAPQPAPAKAAPVPVAAAPSASAATPVTKAAAAAYRVKPGVVFNDITGTKAEQLRILAQIEGAIENAPPGSTIRIAQYLFDLDTSANKMIAAHKRGVRVQMLIDDNPATPQTRRVRAALGTDRTKGSYVAKCWRSCMSSASSVMHAKFFLFSQSGVSRTVSMISAANLYTGNTFTSWNNLHTLVGDQKMYASLNRYFDDMLTDVDRPNYYRTTTSGMHKAYYLPRAARPGTDDVTLLGVLNNVKCTGAAPGYGTKGRTVVRVAQWGWSSARLDIARRLWALHNGGCVVQVIGNQFQTSASVTRTLLKPSKKYGVMAVYNAGIDVTGDGRRDYMHHKVLTISGVWFGHKDRKVVYTGSANFTGPGTLSNNEIILRVVHNGTYNAYAKNLTYIRDKWTRRVTRPPVVTARQSAQVDRRLESGDPEESGGLLDTNR